MKNPREYYIETNDVWLPWTGSYRKEECYVFTRDGKIYGRCWPNDGKFHVYSSGEQIDQDQVSAIKYVEPDGV